MANEMVTQLPTVANALPTDIIYAVQGNVSVQETLQQVINLGLSSTVLNFAGNPNGSLPGTLNQLCYDTVNGKLYICTTAGSSSTAVWTLIGATVIAPVQGGTGISNPTAHTIPIAEGLSNYNFLALTNGQVLVGSTGLDPVPATLTAGTNITITNTAGAVTIASTGTGGFSWTVVTGASQNMTSFNGYIANHASLVSLLLPSSSSVGDEISIVGMGAGGWSITQGSGQIIHFGSSATTVGAGGSLSSTGQFDSINLVCTVANTTWTAQGGAQGILTVV